MTDVGIGPPGEPARGEDEVARGTTRGSVRQHGLGRRRPGDRSRSFGPLVAAVGLAIAVGSVGAAVGLHGRLDSGPGAGADTPPARSGAAMAFDPDHGVVVMFGGVDQHHRSLGDTWTWDGGRWTQQHPRTSPPAREQAAMAWDAAGHRIVLAGGLDNSRLVPTAHGFGYGSGGVVSGSTGMSAGPAFVGAATPHAVTAPSFMSVPCPSFTPGRGPGVAIACAQIVPCQVGRPGSTTPPPAQPCAPAPPCAPSGSGGCNSRPVPQPVGPMLGDTWTWDGSNWTDQHPRHNPTGRLSLSADPVTGGVVALSLDVVGMTSVSISSCVAMPALGKVPAKPEPCPAGPVTCGSAGASAGVKNVPPVGGQQPQPAPPPSPCPVSLLPPPNPAASTWTWDGRDWTPHPQPPVLRRGSTLAADPAAGRVVQVRFPEPCAPGRGLPVPTAVVGGAGVTTVPAPVHADGRTPVPSPAPSVSAAPPPPAQPCVEIEAGLPAGGAPPAPLTSVVAPPAEVEEWTGSGWRVRESSGPASLPTGQLVGDAADSSLVLYDGAATWVRTGDGWKSRGRAGLPWRTGAAVAYDGARHAVVMFGGQVSGRSASGSTVTVVLDDTWTWDGTRWTKQGGGPVPQLSTPPPPAPTVPPPAPPVTLLPAPTTAPPVPTCHPGPGAPEPLPCTSPPDRGAPPTPTPSPG